MTNEAEAELLKALRSDDQNLFSKAHVDISCSLTNPSNVMPVLCDILLHQSDSFRRQSAASIIQGSMFFAKNFGVHSHSPYATELHGQTHIPSWEEYRHRVAKRVVPSLIKALSDSDFSVCSAAIRALIEFGPDAAPAYSALVKVRDRRDDFFVQQWEKAKWYERVGIWLIEAWYHVDRVGDHQRLVDKALSAIVGRDVE